MKTVTARNANGRQTRETKGDKAAMLEVVVNNPMPMAKALEVAAMAKTPVMLMAKTLGAVVMVKTPVMPMVKVLEVATMEKIEVANLEMMDKRVGLRREPAPARAVQAKPLNCLSGAKKT
jgi:hypothetical protein